MKNILKNHCIAVTGDFGTARSHENIKRWIELNGGDWATAVRSDVTHLICSTEHWKRKVGAVKAALKLKSVKIIAYDWLEDSLQAQRHKRESKYDLTVQEKQKAKVKARKAKRTRQKDKKEVKFFEKGCISSKKQMFSDNHHIYRDPSGFDYDITLKRTDAGTNSTETYQLRIYESHALPHTYSTHLRYYRPSYLPIDQIQASLGSTYSRAFQEFCKVFRGKTRVHWDERMDGCAVPERSIKVGTTTTDGKRQMNKKKATENQPFIYVPSKKKFSLLA